MKEKLSIFAIIVVLAVTVMFAAQEQKEQEKFIRDWAVQNEQEILRLEPTSIDNGPYWIVDRENGDDVWFMESRDLNLKRNRKSYFLFPILGNTEHEFVN